MSEKQVQALALMRAFQGYRAACEKAGEPAPGRLILWVDAEGVHVGDEPKATSVFAVGATDQSMAIDRLGVGR